MSFFFYFIPKLPKGPWWTSFVISIALGTSFLSMLFKFMHWPGSPILYYTSIPLIIICSLIVILYRRSVKPVFKRATFILLALVILTRSDFIASGLFSLSFNYKLYEKRSRIKKIYRKVFRETDRGGYLNPTTEAERDSLRLYAEKFTNILFEKPNQGRLNEEAWDVYRRYNDTIVLNEALKWAKKSVELEELYDNTDTYAHLLYKLKRYEQAETQAKKAIELAKLNNERYSSTSELLEKIRRERRQ